MKKDYLLHPVIMVTMFVSAYAVLNIGPTSTNYEGYVATVKLLHFFGSIAMYITIWQYASLLFKEIYKWAYQFVEEVRKK